jgi:hypothetical protein
MRIAANWQPIDLTTMAFPSEMLVDYVRVYQQENRMNIGCSPEDYPTADYIANHAEAYHSLSFLHRGPSSMLTDNFPSRRRAIAVLDDRSSGREPYLPQEQASASYVPC